MKRLNIRTGPVGFGRSWRIRHASVVTLALLMGPVALSVAARSGADPIRTSLPVLVAALFAVLAATERTADELRPLLATLAMLTAGSVLVWVSHGSFGAHLGYVALVTVATLYHDWVSYVVLLLYTWFVYGYIAHMLPGVIFNASTESTGGLTLAITATVCSTTGMVSWLIADRAQNRRAELELALNAASQRQQQALEIHDNVVQGLATIVYALEAGDAATAAGTASSTLENAKDIIGRLLNVDGVDLSDVLDRHEPAQNELES